MAQDLTERQRAQLIEIQSRLSSVAGFLQEMTSTVHAISWHIEDALWENERPLKAGLEDEVRCHEDEIYLLIGHTSRLLAALERYTEVDDADTEYRRAINALANAGMLAPQQEPGPLSPPQLCESPGGCGYRHCFGMCGNPEPPPGLIACEP